MPPAQPDDAAAAAAEASPSDEAHILDVLPHVARHAHMPWGTIGALLCASKATAAIIDSCCAGLLHITITPRLKRRLLKWLSKHAIVLGSINDYSGGGDAITALPAALSKAAALHGGLLLRQLTTSSLPVFQAVSSSSSSFLTVLSLNLTEEQLFPNTTAAVDSLKALGGQLQYVTLSAGFALFDAARYLKLFSHAAAKKNPRVQAVKQLMEGKQQTGKGGRGKGGRGKGGRGGGGGTEADAPTCGLAGLLRQALPHLTALTKLEVEEVADACVFKYAPPQLCELVVVSVGDMSERPLELGHLTALTMMEWGRDPEDEREGWRVIRDKDTLPPNLVELSVADATSASPLLSLTKLQELAICTHCHLPSPELKRLSVLTQLQSVKLGYLGDRGDDGEQQAHEDFSGWSSVPALAELEFHRMLIHPASHLPKHLAGLSTLTRLVWDETYLMPVPEDEPDAAATAGPPVSHWMLPAVPMARDGGLSVLGGALPSSLRRLELDNFVPEPLSDSDFDDEDYDDEDYDDDASLGPRDPEADVIMGLRHFSEFVLDLPKLQYVEVRYSESGMSGLSPAGQRVAQMIFSGMVGEPRGYNASAIRAAFRDAYPEYGDEDDDEWEDTDVFGPLAAEKKQMLDDFNRLVASFRQPLGRPGLMMQPRAGGFPPIGPLQGPP